MRPYEFQVLKSLYETTEASTCKNEGKKIMTLDVHNI
jgi:hypothetical protein